MKISGKFRARVLAREWVVGTWLNLGSPVTAELAGLSGLDWVVLDHEHGPGGEDTMLHQLQAVAATPAVPIVRIAANEAPRFKRALDLGAQGIMVPFVNTAAEAAAAVSALRYPPADSAEWPRSSARPATGRTLRNITSMPTSGS